MALALPALLNPQANIAQDAASLGLKAPAPAASAPRGIVAAVAPTTSGGGGTSPASSGPSAADLAAIQNELGGITGVAGSTTAADVAALTGGANGITATLNANQQAQNNLDLQSTQAALAKDQGLQGVNEMVGEGLQSAGVNLDNNNAANSSAAAELARAYGIEGRDAASQVGNQYAQAQNTTATAAKNLTLQEESGEAALSAQQQTDIADIIAAATGSLNSLATSAIYENDPGAVDISGQSASIKQNATAALAALDAQIAGTANPTAETPAQIAEGAQNLAVAGTAAANPYSYTNVGPAQLASGPVPSALPIMAAVPSGNKQDQTTLPI